ncbi:Putative protein in type-1 retrotransposable element R1DM, partial [Araneus ventricosus]
MLYYIALSNNKQAFSSENIIVPYSRSIPVTANSRSDHPHLFPAQK